MLLSRKSDGMMVRFDTPVSFMDTSKPRVVVIGAGINGRMVQHFIPSAEILDWSPVPDAPPRPRFFGANYLWERIPGIACRHVEVYTTIDGEIASMASVRAYKSRIGKELEAATDDQCMSLIGTQFAFKTDGYELVRYPEANIRYECHVDYIDLDRHELTLKNGERVRYNYLVSTVPLPSLLAMAQIRVTGVFRSQMIRVRAQTHPALGERGRILVDYITDTTRAEYRRTTRHGEQHDETLEFKFRDENIYSTYHRLLPGKIWDTPRSTEFLDMLWAHDVITFGRYGSWNSDELVHHTVQRIIDWGKNVELEVAHHG